MTGFGGCLFLLGSFLKRVFDWSGEFNCTHFIISNKVFENSLLELLHAQWKAPTRSGNQQYRLTEPFLVNIIRNCANILNLRNDTD